MEVAQEERKWWKPLLPLNRERRVLEAQEAQRRKGQAGGAAGEHGVGGFQPRAAGGGGGGAKAAYASNRSRAGVTSTPTESSGLGDERLTQSFGLDAEL